MLLITLVSTNDIIKRMFLSVWDGLNYQNLNQSFTYDDIVFTPVHDDLSEHQLTYSKIIKLQDQVQIPFDMSVKIILKQ